MKNIIFIAVGLLITSVGHAAQQEKQPAPEQSEVVSFGCIVPSVNGFYGIASREKVITDQVIRAILQTAVDHADSEATEITIPIGFGAGNERRGIGIFTLTKQENGNWLIQYKKMEIG